ncbi:MAG: glycosyltransferase family 4 protein [Candidatus Eisenbacteria bacterium]|uniref:Glycosyltransferase family 4 protein n=1 Tax=Eiseniibacteriota bacterium TaxID=2212470 RepID=A0A948RRF3_UNCEI|nr:glycosyltransferase family 4 protein [Candidatus Eisenbacteria bacterium]MBU1950163.1 glycosyltransferase family 4 protein [Candidatus Eisenbacteria bacterium]MBU2689615.1 glycosyltransferase family 4 protein [Candidatus Eisenbacteria bacterium]
MTILGIYSWTRLWSMGSRRGAESFSLALKALPRWGHTLHVVTPREKGQPRHEVWDGVHIHRLSTTFNFLPDPFRRSRFIRIAERILKYVLFQLFAGLEALRISRRIYPTAVVAYGAFAVPAAWWVSRMRGLPLVTRLFGQSLNLCLGHRFKFMGNFPEIFAMKIPSSFLILHDDGAEGDKVAGQLKISASRFRYWKNGIDPDLYRPDMDRSAVRREMGFGPDEILLFGVARMVLEKHLERVVSLLPSLLIEEPKLRLFLVGDGPKRPELEQLVRELGLESKVYFAGAQPREELYKYFNAGDIFFSVSDRTNGGNPTVEAMYCSRCVIVLNTGSTDKLVKHGETGIIVEPDHLEELPERILEVIRDVGYRERLGRAARAAIARQIPTIEERQRMEVGLIEQAVKNHAGSQGGATPDEGTRSGAAR